jgi:hypothetical protein
MHLSLSIFASLNSHKYPHVLQIKINFDFLWMEAGSIETPEKA